MERKLERLLSVTGVARVVSQHAFSICSREGHS